MTFEVEQVVVTVIKYHLIQKRLFLALLEDLLEALLGDEDFALFEDCDHVLRLFLFVLFCEEEVLEREFFPGALIKSGILVVPDDRLLAHRGHCELQNWQRLVRKEIRLLNSNCFVLDVFFNTFDGVIEADSFL